MSRKRALFATREGEDGGHWLSVSDLMAGLMMIFLFIAIIYMRQVQKVIVLADDTHTAIYTALYDEFKDDLSKWSAEIDPETMTIRFNEPDILFPQNSAALRPEFKVILVDFFPRYVRTLDVFQPDIDEIRVEGHTSSEFRSETDETNAYFRNMDLSQDRTRNVLEYCLQLENLDGNSLWLKEKVAAVGLSSARLIRDENEIEDKERSRRVEFTVKTNFEKRIIEQTLAKRARSATQ